MVELINNRDNHGLKVWIEIIMVWRFG